LDWDALDRPLRLFELYWFEYVIGIRKSKMVV
jgi:hypothetical protein